MKIFAALFLGALTMLAAESVSVFGHHWAVRNSSDWKIDEEGGSIVLHLVKARGPMPGPRRPIQFALADTPSFKKVKIDLDVKPRQRSLILVYAYRDPAHFNYAHLSTDTGGQQPVHNGIFHVYGGERVRISNPAGPASFPEINRWYHVQFVQDGRSVHIKVDGKDVPTLQAMDYSLTSGKVGLGSFDETADFKNVKISGTPATD